MRQNERPIGMLDSGVGGLTVARQLRRLLPDEDIVYIGDSANVPYGNRDAEDILALTLRMLRFLEAREVKCVAVACNTISTIIDRLRPVSSVPLVDIVSCGADYVVRERLPRVGLFATEFTARSGVYDARVHARLPDCELIAVGSPTLAALIDRGETDGEAVRAEIRARVGEILARAPMERLLLACTHFSIVADSFRACFPDLRFIDPAAQQAAAVKTLLAERGLLDPRGRGALAVYTTGDPAVCAAVAGRLGLTPDVCEKIIL